MVHSRCPQGAPGALRSWSALHEEPMDRTPFAPISARALQCLGTIPPTPVPLRHGRGYTGKTHMGAPNTVPISSSAVPTPHWCTVTRRVWIEGNRVPQIAAHTSQCPRGCACPLGLSHLPGLPPPTLCAAFRHVCGVCPHPSHTPFHLSLTRTGAARPCPGPRSIHLIALLERSRAPRRMRGQEPHPERAPGAPTSSPPAVGERPVPHTLCHSRTAAHRTAMVWSQGPTPLAAKSLVPMGGTIRRTAKNATSPGQQVLGPLRDRPAWEPSKSCVSLVIGPR